MRFIVDRPVAVFMLFCAAAVFGPGTVISEAAIDLIDKLRAG